MTTCNVGATVEAAPRTRLDSGTLVGSASAMTSLFLIGTAAPVAALIREIPVLVGQGLRFALAGLILIMVLAATGRLRAAIPNPGDLGRIALLGSIGIAGFTIFFVSATFHADPALVGSVLAATPVLLAVVTPLAQRRRPARMVVIGALTVAAGTAVAAGAGSATPLGLLLAIGALGSEVGFTLFAVRLIERRGTVATTMYASLAGAAVLLAAGMIINGPREFAVTTAPAGEWLALLFLSLVVSIGANLAWYTALPRIGPDRAGLFYAFAPIGALVAGLLLGTSAPGPVELVGLAVVIAGLIIGLRSRQSPGGQAPV